MIPSTDPIDHYRTMLLIRAFEERVETLFSEGLIRGTAHPAIGQEASAVGVCSQLSDGDYVTSTHRGHGHFLACGADPGRMMAELYGKETGYSHGRGGSQVMADYALGFLGGNGITGGSIHVATGAALAMRRQRNPNVAVCFFGDGAANQGSFHESLNMAGLWKLPVLYVCENNQFAMSMRVSDSVAVTDISARAAAYGFEGVIVDGNDLSAVQAAVAEAREHAVSGAGPVLVECKTYRMSGHSRGDARKYRSREEEREWSTRDPIPRFSEELIERGLFDADRDAALRADVDAEVDRAVEFAASSPEPDPATLLEGLYP